MRRARRGDERAFAELVRMHQEIAFRIAYLISGNEAEDAHAHSLPEQLYSTTGGISKETSFMNRLGL